MSKLLKIGLFLAAISLVAIGVVFLIPWGNAESVVEKSEVEVPTETLETANDISFKRYVRNYGELGFSRECR